MKTLKLTILVIFVTLSLVSCTKRWDTTGQIDAENPIEIETISTLDDISVPANFNWKTFKDIEITVNGANSGIVEAASNKDIVYQKIYLGQNQSYTMKLSVPTYESSIRLKMNNQTQLVNISSGHASYSFN